ncbi:flavin reductase family protein [Microbacterium sp. B19]|uniref:flavin reductase family protein n=1 Tax=Microbacterium sp. B19 TaxID=96765 RepID=UPI000349FE6E|nr:flavin reductase [Microbacterium sp. B19]
MFIDAAGLSPADTYRLLVGSVVPRPIAWVTSGREPVNLAPFSSFTWVSQHPAMLGFTVNRRAHGRKDTIRNIEEYGEYVVNIADESMLVPSTPVRRGCHPTSAKPSTWASRSSTRG